MNFKVIVPYILSLILLVISILVFVDNNKLKNSLEKSEQKYTDLKSNSKSEVQNDAREFLKAFYNYEDRPKKENLKGLATKELQNTIFQTYEMVDEKKINLDIDYKSEIKDILIYHAQDDYDNVNQAHVLATFKSIITLNGDKNESTVFAELVLTKEKNRWIVSQYKSLKGVDEFEGN